MIAPGIGHDRMGILKNPARTWPEGSSQNAFMARFSSR